MSKKYVSLEKLSLYNDKINKVISDGDAATLASAKSYADDLAANYDAAGSAATVQGKLDEEVIRAKAAEEVNAAAAKQAQDEVDALEVLVGALPEGTAATSVIDYVNVKTAGIATDAALGELNSQVAGLQTAVQGIQSDYLKGEDKTEMNDAIAAEQARAEGVESGLRTDVDAIKGDYLKDEDKEELQGKIDAKVAQADYDAKMEEIDGDIDGLQTKINTIMSNPDTEGAINSINEFTQYVADHGTIADGFRADIDQNEEDIAAMDAAYKAADSALSGRLDALEAIDHEAYVAADTALKDELNAEIAKKADVSVVEGHADAIEALQEADAGIIERVAAVEAQLGDGEGSVADIVAGAKQEAIDAAADDATAKANDAESNAKTYADDLNTSMNTRVEALEAIDHDHANKAELDLIASGDKAKWDAAEGNAKTYADGLDSAMDTRVAAVEDGLASFVEVSEEEINALFA